MPSQVVLHPAARRELGAITEPDRRPMENAPEKLVVLGDRLGAPHSSSVRGVSETLRELRPRAGRSRWRALYRRVGDLYVIDAIGPKASVDPAGFRRAVADALMRLETFAAGQDGDAIR